MRLFTSGSAPLAASAHEAFTAATGHDMLERYGMTEVGIVLSNPLPGPRVPGRVGYPLPGMRARIVVPGLEEHVDDNVIGMLHIKGPSVFSGYHNHPHATAKVLLDHGWMRTADLARRDNTGSIQIVGREDHLILTGGFNVYPMEVRTVLCEQPGVREVCVYGQPDADLGQVVCAAYVGDADESQLRTAVRLALSGYKVPRHDVRLPALPRNPTGKVMRAALPTLPHTD
ncbi:MAG: malonyl-CoA/methylmalonyl-CoA synthetase [Myxococcota bacterium]|jgi:malonyl-CoA/methylmalonyl-CoA synthetase